MLFLAVSKLDVIAVDKILCKEPMLYYRDLSTGDYPVHLLMTIFSKNPINAKRIMEIFNHYKVDFQAKNNELWGPIHIAVKKGSFDGVEALMKINKKASVNGQIIDELQSFDINEPGGKEMMTPLHLATTGSYYRIVHQLIENGADLFALNALGKDPFTSISNNLLMIKILKKAQVSQTK